MIIVIQSFKLFCAERVIENYCELSILLSLQMFGCGSVAQHVLSEGTHAIFLTVNFAFGFGATLGILVCGQVSGIQMI